MAPNTEKRWSRRAGQPLTEARAGQGTARAHASRAGTRLGLPTRRPGAPPAEAELTFSVVMLVSASWRFCVKMMLKTAWERLLVSFMFVAATVLGNRSHTLSPRVPWSGVWAAGAAGPLDQVTRRQLPGLPGPPCPAWWRPCPL